MSRPTLEMLGGVLAHLTAALPEQEVDWWPDQLPVVGRRLIHPRGSVWVGYGGSVSSVPGSASDPWRDTGALAQRREVQILLLLQTPTLRGDVGLLALLDDLRTILLGFSPPHGSPIRGLHERFIDAQNGLWTWEATYVTDLLAVVDRELVTEPLLTRIAVADDAQTTHIIRRDPDTGAVITEYLDP